MRLQLAILISGLSVSSSLGILIPTRPVFAANEVSISGNLPQSISVSGDFELPVSPVRLRTGISAIADLATWLNVTADVPIWKIDNDDIRGVFGINETWAHPSNYFGSLEREVLGQPADRQPVRFIIGASYSHDFGDRLSLVLTPNFTIYAPWFFGIPAAYRWPIYNFAETAIIGLPWIEVRYKLDSTTKLSLRSSWLPFSISRSF